MDHQQVFTLVAVETTFAEVFARLVVQQSVEVLQPGVVEFVSRLLAEVMYNDIFVPRKYADGYSVFDFWNLGDWCRDICFCKFQAIIY